MKVYVICFDGETIAFPTAFLDKDKAEERLRIMQDEMDAGGLMLVEIEVDEYPDITDLHNWLNTLTNPSNLPDVLAYLKRADDAHIYYEVLNSAYEQQIDPNFDIVNALEEACLRWDVEIKLLESKESDT